MPARCTGPFPIFTVTDVDRSARFYTEVFGFETSYRWPKEADLSAEFVTMSLDGREIGLGRGTTVVSGVELCIEVDDMPAAWGQALAAGATPITEPALQPWGESMAYVGDPDGIRIHLYGTAG
jgi:catechol 2,3-dioxygenase-like lactoylglutathione lyase family enzyme